MVGSTLEMYVIADRFYRQVDIRRSVTRITMKCYDISKFTMEEKESIKLCTVYTLQNSALLSELVFDETSVDYNIKQYIRRLYCLQNCWGQKKSRVRLLK